MINYGDVIELSNGDSIRVTMPTCFLYDNDDYCNYRLTTGIVTIGRQRNGYDTGLLGGRWVVTDIIEDEHEDGRFFPFTQKFRSTTVYVQKLLPSGERSKLIGSFKLTPGWENSLEEPKIVGRHELK